MTYSVVVTQIKRWRILIIFIVLIVGIGAAFSVGSLFAFRAYLRDARQGDVFSQIQVAKRYSSKEQYEEAAHWYRQAANQGNLVATYQLALIHRNSRIDDADRDQAFALMKEAAEGHYMEAQLTLSNYYRIGDVIERNYAKAYGWADIAKYNKLKVTGDKAAQVISHSIALNWSREHLTKEEVEAAHAASLKWREQFPDYYRLDLTEYQEETEDDSE